MRTIAVYPGSFDPPTYGHLDIIDRSSRVFSRVIVAVARNLRKNEMFTTAERLDMLRKLTRSHANVEYDFQMAQMNKKLASEVDTVFMMTGERFSYISSNIVKEIASFGGKIDDLVPPLVKQE